MGVSFVSAPQLNNPTPRLIDGFVDLSLFRTTLDSSLQYLVKLENIDLAVSIFTSSVVNSIRFDQDKELGTEAVTKDKKFGR